CDKRANRDSRNLAACWTDTKPACNLHGGFKPVAGVVTLCHHVISIVRFLCPSQCGIKPPYTDDSRRVAGPDRSQTELDHVACLGEPRCDARRSGTGFYCMGYSWICSGLLVFRAA